MNKIRLFCVALGMGCFVWITLAEAEEVYNFYFQKGAAPGTVIQGGGGQSTAPEKTEAPAAAVAPSAPVVQASTTPLPASEPEVLSYKPYSLSLGYTRLSDPVGSGMAYAIGLQYNFNRYLGIRFQARLRNLQSESSSYLVMNQKSSRNRWSGLGAVVFTPVHVDLLGHKFIKVSGLAGLESYRTASLTLPGRGGRESKWVGKTGFAPFIGASAMLGLNDNVGLELQAQRSTEATALGANIAFQF